MARSSKPNRKATRLSAGDIATLVAEIDDALGSARAFAMALEPMGLGLRALEDDYSPALITVTEAVLGHLNCARGACARIIGAAAR